MKPSTATWAIDVPGEEIVIGNMPSVEKGGPAMPEHGGWEQG